MPGSKVENLAARRAACGLGVGNLARLAKVSDHIVNQLEAGATCEPREAARIIAVLAGLEEAAAAAVVERAVPESWSRGVVESVVKRRRA